MKQRIEIIKDGREVPILPAAPDVSSSGSPWEGLLLERHFAAPGEVPTCEQSGYVVGLNYPLAEQPPPRFHWRLDGGGERECVARSGYICLLPRGSRYSNRWTGPVNVLITELSPVLIERVAVEADAVRAAELSLDVDVDDSRIERLVLSLHDELVAGCPAGRLYGEAVGTALAVHLLHTYSVFPPKVRDLKGGMTKHKLRRLTDYINDNLAADVTLSELAQVAAMNQFHLARTFKQTTGQTLHQYVIRRRVEAAKRLLADRNLSIVEVALGVGFGNQSHFTKLFHRITGVTPKTYRDNL